MFYYCSDPEVDCNYTKGFKWCAAKMPCGKCFSKRAPHPTCYRRLTKKFTCSDTCKYRFICFTSGEPSTVDYENNWWYHKIWLLKH